MVSALTGSDIINPSYLVLSVVTQSDVLSTFAVLLHKAMCYQHSLCRYTKRCVINIRCVATESDVLLSTLAQC